MDCFVNRLQAILEGTATIEINNDAGKVHFADRLLLKGGFEIIALPDYCPI